MTPEALSQEAGRIRLDKWLFFARVTKSRTLAKALIEGGGVRVDGERMTNAARLVGPASVLTITLARAVLVLRIRQCGQRRGPASEAQTLYEDLTPALPQRQASTRGDPVAGPRPDARARAEARRLKGFHSFQPDKE